MGLRSLKQTIHEKIELARKNKEQALALKKKEVIEYLDRPLTEAEIFNINCQIIANSAGWIGGNWTEKDIKLHYLKSNRSLFSQDEYQQYVDQILYSNVKIKK